MNENNSFKEIIDKIEPEDGARERMLNNIKRKAAEQQAAQKSAKKSSAFMKIARWALPAAACSAIAVVGFNVVPRLVSPPIESSGVEIPNPFQTVNSADDFEQQLHFRADAPAGSEDTAYSILDGSIAQVDFIYGGKSYTLRASRQSGDFSGINGTLIKSDKIDAQTDAVLDTIRGTDYNYFKLKWTNGAVTFILSNGDETTAESITEIYQKIK